MKPIMVAIKDLRTDLFVRTALNHDRVTQFGLVIEAGEQELPPIEVTRNLAVVDGRHRIAAYDMMSKTEIPAVYVEVQGEVGLIARAFQANLGGSLPPTMEDIKHTVLLLLDRGESGKRIGELLNLPGPIARKYVSDVKSRQMDIKLQRAAAAMVDEDLSAPQAAEREGVDLGQLKTLISGHKKKNREGLPEILRELTKAYRSVGSKSGHILKTTLEKFQDNELSIPQVRQIIEHVRQLQKKGGKAVDDWEKRFDAESKTTAKKAA